MNRILLALLLLVPAALSAQETICTPFDDNGDNVVGIGDLIGLLARFGDSDLDQDGIWDSEDDCVGAYDTCGVCNGPGPQVLAIDTIIITYDSIYVETIEEWLTYELNVDTLLHLVCENPGCTDPVADNFDPYAEEGGLCTYGGPCFGPTFDGYTYEAVEIGGQCWFAENLQTTLYANGDVIPAGLTEGEWNDTSAGATAVYGEGSSSCSYLNFDIDACDEVQSLEAYGRLYNWYAVDDARGLCPAGWHVPTDGEWTDLEDYITSQGFDGTEGTALKSTSGWTLNGNGTDDFGFSALPGGYRYYNNGIFINAGANGSWWSSSSWYRYLYHSIPLVQRGSNYPRFGFSVRCLRDA
jgi:uncharacterized protein (TIGR02145 family)